MEEVLNTISSCKIFDESKPLFFKPEEKSSSKSPNHFKGSALISKVHQCQSNLTSIFLQI